MHVDGNVLAGPLSDVFSVDMTTATGTCASCADGVKDANEKKRRGLPVGSKNRSSSTKTDSEG